MFVQKARRPINDRPKEWKSKKSSDHQKVNFLCIKCQKPGHRAAECRTKTSSTEQGGGIAQESSFAALTNEENAPGTAQVSNVGRWCLDSGSTSHMCGNPGKFEEIKEPAQRRLNLASNASTSIDGTGLVRLTIRNGKEKKTVNLKDSLYVPDLRTNLLSVSKIADNGFNVNFDCNGAVVRDRENNVILTAEKKTGCISLRKPRKFPLTLKRDVMTKC